MLILLVIVVVCSYVIYAVPLKEVLNQSYQIKARLAEAGYAGPVIFTLGAVLYPKLSGWSVTTS